MEKAFSQNNGSTKTEWVWTLNQAINSAQKVPNKLCNQWSKFCSQQLMLLRSSWCVASYLWITKTVGVSRYCNVCTIGIPVALCRSHPSWNTSAFESANPVWTGNSDMWFPQGPLLLNLMGRNPNLLICCGTVQLAPFEGSLSTVQRQNIGLE